MSGNAKETIFAECMKPGGFAEAIRENKVDEEGFRRLVDAVKMLASTVENDDSIDRLTVASLFELPWEIENTVEHYSSQSNELGSRVSKMADELREAINELLWGGLESHYENL